MSPTDTSEEAKESISGYLAQMQEMMAQFDPTLSSPSVDTLLAQGASKLIDEPATVTDGDGPEVLRMGKGTFIGVDRDRRYS